MSDEGVGKALVRSAAVGLVGALGLAAVTLLAMAVLRLRVDCAGMGPEECTFEEQLAASVARMQTLAAVGCASVAVGGGLLLRRR